MQLSVGLVAAACVMHMRCSIMHHCCPPCIQTCSFGPSMPTIEMCLPGTTIERYLVWRLTACPTAARALESMRPDALVVDPLARILAGPKAMARHEVGRRLKVGWVDCGGCRYCTQCTAQHMFKYAGQALTSGRAPADGHMHSSSETYAKALLEPCCACPARRTLTSLTSNQQHQQGQQRPRQSLLQQQPQQAHPHHHRGRCLA
jgi:hypothetical protein